MMGSGKTAFGRALALRLSLPFRDADHEIEQVEGKSIAALFAEKGEAYFRRREKEILAELLEGTPAIIATGGGAVLDEGTRKLIALHAIAIWLQADIEMLYQRVKHDTGRPLLKAPKPREKLAELLEARRAYYAEAPIHIATDEKTFNETLEDIVERLKTATRE